MVGHLAGSVATVAIDNIWIEMPDGRRLHARRYLPSDADRRPVPAILHYHPYPLDWFTRGRDDGQLQPLAEQGFACLRVDMAGSGGSDGLLHGEYLKAEIDDGVELLRWLAEQPWCDGNTGVMGTSWSGCNALQIAARRPPSLRAIISCDASDDHFVDDIHYVGGCVSGLEMLNWGAWCHGFSVAAPDPALVGDDWLDRWHERLRGVEPAVAAWLSHQRRDSFWQSTAIADDYSAIECPILMIGGWGDGYRSAVFRLLDALPEQVWALVGPWCHGWPNSARPGPNLDMTAIMTRWWRHWTGCEREGLDRDPRLIAFLEDSRRPYESMRDRRGRWLALERWSSSGAPFLTLEGRRSSLGGEQSGSIAWHHQAGAATCLWCAYGDAADQAADQRADDALALCLDWMVEDPVELLGTPLLTLDLAASAARAQIAVRLCDVAPDGSSTLITDGQLNLTRRDDHQAAGAVEIGQVREISLPLRSAGYRVPEGHKLRLAISPGSWPMAWPSPQPCRLDVMVGSVTLRLPLATDGVAAPSRCTPALPRKAESPAESPPPLLGARRRTISSNLSDGSSHMRLEQRDQRDYEDGLSASECAITDWFSSPGDPLGVENSVELWMERRRADWHSRLEINGRLVADAEAFHLTFRVHASSNGKVVHDATSRWSIPRDLA